MLFVLMGAMQKKKSNVTRMPKNSLTGINNMKKGIKGIYHPHTNSMERGYTFAIELEKNIEICGEGYQTPEDRDNTAKRIAEELGIILTSE